MTARHVVRRVGALALTGTLSFALGVSTLGGPAEASAGGGADRSGTFAAASQNLDVAAWSPTTAYNGGDQATHRGSLWQAGWWTKGQEPGDPNGPWQEIVTTPEGEAVWTPSRSFNAGDVVVHQGVHYVAKWWTRNQLPTDPNGPWRAQRTPGVPGTPTDWHPAYEYSTGDLVRHGGHLWVALWWAGRQEPGPLDGPWGEVAVTLQGATVWTPTRAFTTGDKAVYQGVEYVAKWWTRNQAPGDSSGPWRSVTGAAPAAPRAWSAEATFEAGEVTEHRAGRYLATQTNRAAEPGDRTGPWVEVPGSVAVLAPPAVAGRAKVGRTLRARTGTWAEPGLRFTYRWVAGRAPLPRSDGRRFKVPAKLRGKKLQVVITARRGGEPVGSAASAPVKVRPRGR